MKSKKQSKNKKLYKVSYSVLSTGECLVEATSKGDAIYKFESGEYDWNTEKETSIEEVNYKGTELLKKINP